MPELPDVSLYVKRIEERVLNQPLTRMVFFNPFVLRSIDPKPEAFAGLKVTSLGRLGKRIVIGFEGDLFVVIHLMIAGRFQWTEGAPAPAHKTNKALHAVWEWSNGQLSLAESSTKKRASVYLVRGQAGLDAHRRDGLDVLQCSLPEFTKVLKRRNQTVKNALTDPSIFDGIGNAFSDEILFDAKISPSKLTSSMSAEQIKKLFESARSNLSDWIDLLDKMYPGFPKPSQITAFRPEFNVHGRFGKACNVCGSPIQHIVYATNETNYCATCQNEGKVLADRSLSRLLK